MVEERITHEATWGGRADLFDIKSLSRSAFRQGNSPRYVPVRSRCWWLRGLLGRDLTTLPWADSSPPATVARLEEAIPDVEELTWHVSDLIRTEAGWRGREELLDPSAKPNLADLERRGRAHGGQHAEVLFASVEHGTIARWGFDTSGQPARKVVVKESVEEERIFPRSYEVWHRRSAGVLSQERQAPHILEGQRRITMVEALTVDDSSPQVVLSTGGDVLPPGLLRTFAPGEKIGDLIAEGASLTIATGTGHGLVRRPGDVWAIIFGSPGGISGTGAVGVDLVFGDTRAYAAGFVGPSAAARAALRQLGQSSPYVLESGTLVKFWGN